MKDAPKIKFNYMSSDEDWDDMRKAIEIARQVMRQPSMADIAGMSRRSYFVSYDHT